MSITVQCSGCGGKFRAPDEAVGKRAKCPKCSAIIEVDSTQERQTTQTSAVEKGEPAKVSIPTSVSKRAILVSVLLVVAITLHLLTCSWGVRSWAFEAENPPLIRLKSCCDLDNEVARERDALARVRDNLGDENKKFLDKDGHAQSDLTPSERHEWFHNADRIEAIQKEIEYNARYALGSLGLWAKDKDTRDTALLLGVFLPILLIVTAIVVVFIPTTALCRGKEPQGQ